MKELLTGILVALLMIQVPVSACTTNYEAVQPIYCQYCGYEAWQCQCQFGYSDNVAYDCSYTGETTNDCGTCGYTMAHWANIRDCSGNVIGTACEGGYVEVVGTDPADPSRVLVYCDGVYGSVLSSCVYGGYVWDGGYTGGCGEGYQDYTDCQQGESVDCSYSYDIGYSCDADYCDYSGGGYDDSCYGGAAYAGYEGCDSYGGGYQLVGYCEQTVYTVTETTTRTWTYAGPRWCR